MRLIIILATLSICLLSCENNGGPIEPTPLSDAKELLSITFIYADEDYTTNIDGTEIALNTELPAEAKTIEVKSITVSEKSTANVKVEDEIDISDGNFTITVTAEDESTQNYLLTATFEDQLFSVVEYDPVPVAKSYATPVYVHYMPWFQSQAVSGYWGSHWKMANKNPNNILSNGRRDIASHYYPLVEPYDSRDPDYLEYALTCIKLAGIDGILIDFYGTSDTYDYPELLEASNDAIEMCEKVGLKFGIVYEDRTIPNVMNQESREMIEIAQSDLIYMDQTYFPKDNYIKINNQPVLLNFGPITVKSNEDWLTIFNAIETNINFLPLAYHPQTYDLTTSVDGVYAWVGEIQTDDLYHYAAQFDITGGGALFEFKEYYEEGGWGATGQEDIASDDGSVLKETLERAKNANTDFIQLITWNDWGEGTAIEPSLDYEYQPLTIVQDFVGMESNQSNLELTVELYKKRKEYEGLAYENQQLDQVFYYLISLQIDEARTLLNEL